MILIYRERISAQHAAPGRSDSEFRRVFLTERGISSVAIWCAELCCYNKVIGLAGDNLVQSWTRLCLVDTERVERPTER